jgi:hypothetical protein
LGSDQVAPGATNILPNPQLKNNESMLGMSVLSPARGFIQTPSRRKFANVMRPVFDCAANEIVHLLKVKAFHLSCGRSSSALAFFWNASCMLLEPLPLLDLRRGSLQKLARFYDTDVC